LSAIVATAVILQAAGCAVGYTVVESKTTSSCKHRIRRHYCVCCIFRWQKGNTALHIASLAGQLNVVNLLIEHGAKVNIQSQVSHCT